MFTTETILNIICVLHCIIKTVDAAFCVTWQCRILYSRYSDWFIQIWEWEILKHMSYSPDMSLFQKMASGWEHIVHSNWYAYQKQTLQVVWYVWWQETILMVCNETVWKIKTVDWNIVINIEVNFITLRTTIYFDLSQEGRVTGWSHLDRIWHSVKYTWVCCLSQKLTVILITILVVAEVRKRLWVSNWAPWKFDMAIFHLLKLSKVLLGEQQQLKISHRCATSENIGENIIFLNKECLIWTC